MISRAINMLRSFRDGMDFYTDNERESSSADISLLDDSPNTSTFRNNANNKTGTSTMFPHNFLRIQPRASIKKNDTFTGQKSEKDKQKITKNSVKEKSSEDAGNHNTSIDSEDDILIINELSKNTIHVEGTSSMSNVENNCRKNKELIRIDDECPNPLIIQLDDSDNYEETNEKNTQSQSSHSSYYSSPQEVFDLCEPEPKWYKMKCALTREKLNPLCDSVTRKNVLKREALKSHIASQSLLEKATNGAIRNSDQVPEISNVENMNPRKKIQSKLKVQTDILVRAKLPLRGKKKTKLFNLKVSQLLAIVNDKNHPLYKWRNLITLKNINKVSEKTRLKMIKLLISLVEVKVVPMKRT